MKTTADPSNPSTLFAPVAVVLAAAAVAYAVGASPTKPRCEVEYQIHLPSAASIDCDWLRSVVDCPDAELSVKPLPRGDAERATLRLSYSGEDVTAAEKLRRAARRLARLYGVPRAWSNETAERLYSIDLKLADLSNSVGQDASAKASTRASLRVEQQLLRELKRGELPIVPRVEKVASIQRADRRPLLVVTPLVLVLLLAAAAVRIGTPPRRETLARAVDAQTLALPARELAVTPRRAA